MNTEEGINRMKEGGCYWRVVLDNPNGSSNIEGSGNEFFDNNCANCDGHNYDCIKYTNPFRKKE